MKTDRRDAKKLVSLYRAGLLRFVHPPTQETEGLRDLLRCREDLRRARVAARNRVLKQLLRHGGIFREGKHAWTQKHRAWVNRQRLDDPLAHAALEQMLVLAARRSAETRRGQSESRTRTDSGFTPKLIGLSPPRSPPPRSS